MAYVIARTLQAFDHLPRVKLGQTDVDVIINEKNAAPYKKLGEADDTTSERHQANPLLEVEREGKGNTGPLGSSGSVGGGSSSNNGGPPARHPSCSPVSSPYAANEELSGVGLFSPAPTRPTTPTFSQGRKGSNAASTLGSSFLIPPTAPLGDC